MKTIKTMKINTIIKAKNKGIAFKTMKNKRQAIQDNENKGEYR